MLKRKLVTFLFFFSSQVAALQISVNPKNYGPEVCATKSTVSGIDVSRHQPDIKWDAVKSAGRNFVYVKASEGRTLADVDYAENIAGLITSKMTYGSYHYFTASVDAVEQANFFLSVVGKNSTGVLPPLFDWEDSNKLAPELVIKNARAFLDRVESVTGKIPVIYTYGDYWISLSNNPANTKSIEQFARYPLFLADQRGNCPQVPAPWTNWMFWQTEINQEPGVVGKVDEDVFNGTLRDLKALLSAPI